MNREMWMRILTVAVVAPYLFRASGKEKGYFAIGLKLVAGGLVVSNIPALMEDYKTLTAAAKNIVANLARAQETLQKQNAARVTVDARANATDAEFSDA